MNGVGSHLWRLRSRAETSVSTASHIVALTGVCCACLATLTVWVRAELGVGGRSFSGLDVPLLAAPVVLAAVIVAVAAIVGATSGSSALQPAASVAALVVVVLSLLVIVIVETVAAVIPDGLLPAFARDYAVDLSAGAGPWVALLGGVVMLAGARGWRPPFVDALPGAVDGRRVHRALPAALLVVTTAAFAWLRYEPWLAASAAGSSEHLTGWSLPWIGPLSLAALLLLAAAVAAGSLLRLEIAGLLAAAGGWLVTFCAALVAQAESALGKLRLDDFGPATARGYAPHVELGVATWLAFVTGLLAAGAGAGLLMLAASPGEDPSWPAS